MLEAGCRVTDGKNDAINGERGPPIQCMVPAFSTSHGVGSGGGFRTGLIGCGFVSTAYGVCSNGCKEAVDLLAAGELREQSPDLCGGGTS